VGPKDGHRIDAAVPEARAEKEGSNAIDARGGESSQDGTGMAEEASPSAFGASVARPTRAIVGQAVYGAARSVPSAVRPSRGRSPIRAMGSKAIRGRDRIRAVGSEAIRGATRCGPSAVVPSVA
jgi:hypothetical protein